MKRIVNNLLTAATVCVLALSSTQLLAKVPPEKAEEIQKLEKARGGKVMGQRVGKKVINAFDLYNEDKVNEALEILLEITAKDTVDKANVNRYIGGMYAGIEGKGTDAIQ